MNAVNQWLTEIRCINFFAKADNVGLLGVASVAVTAQLQLRLKFRLYLSMSLSGIEHIMTSQ